MSWKPGDRAMVAYHIAPQFIGCECTVIAVHAQCLVCLRDGSTAVWPVVVEIEVPGFPDARTVNRATKCSGYGAKPEWLRRPDEPYDGAKPATWDRCPFKPRAVISLDVERERMMSEITEAFLIPPKYFNCRCEENLR